MHFFSLILFSYSGGKVDLATFGIFPGENSKKSSAEKLRLCSRVTAMTESKLDKKGNGK